jgi:uncharacterized protein
MSQHPEHDPSTTPQPPHQPGYGGQPAPGGYGGQPAPGGYGGQPAPGGYGSPPVGGDERSMMLVAHLSAPVAMLVSVGWLPFLGPLLVWLFYKDRSRAVRTVSAGAFNFNVSITVASVVTWISVILTLGLGFLWAIPIWIVLFIVQIWLHVKGAMAASRGEVYDYPFQLRILS